MLITTKQIRGYCYYFEVLSYQLIIYALSTITYTIFWALQPSALV